ncbi:hypothetical protein CYMTET_18715 [Cymbomonas tetramitiformis]|uniref:GED domain-containing protein n=1 Tax=Cymbomonas tetramitiformis TaxID=36881 RepID=A0AAE0G841_9CHLO|nr:hypothetical protein CYMTET_18715 [Cymbomonas tetramitiformis]
MRYANSRRPIQKVRMICDSIPNILKEINDKRDVAAKELLTMGNSLITDSDRRLYYFTSMGTALRKLEDTLAGRAIEAGKPGPVADQQDRYTQFCDGVMNQRLATIAKLEVGSSVIVSLDDGSELQGKLACEYSDSYAVIPKDLNDKQLYTRGLVRVCKFPLNIKPGDLIPEDVELKESKEDEDSGEDEDTEYGLEGGFKYVCIGINPGGHYVLRQLKHLELADVRPDPAWLKEMIRSNRTNDLPCFLSASLFNNIVADMVQRDWSPLCHNLLKETHAALRRVIEDTLCPTFSERFMSLQTHLREQIKFVMNAALTEARSDIESFLTLEGHPYTQNHYLFENISKKRNHLLKQRVLKRMEQFILSASNRRAQEDTKGSTLCEDLMAEFEKDENMSCEDYVAVEMEIILEAYGKVAAKRVIDQVPMILQRMTRSVESQLQRAFHQITDEQLSEMMYESSDFTTKHARMTAQLKDMDAVRAAFREMQTKRARLC